MIGAAWRLGLALPLVVVGCGDGGGSKVADTRAEVGADVVQAQCELAPCRNGGRCVETQGGAACDCLPGTFGPGCEASCPDLPLASTGCKAIDASSWILARDTTTCAWPERFEFRPDGPANEVRVSLVYGAHLESYMMVGPDGSGRYTIEVLLPGGVEVSYGFFVDGAQVGDTLSRRTASCGDAPRSTACTDLLGPSDMALTCGEGAGCVDGHVEGFWLALTAPRDRLVTGLRFRSDWWKKRPTRYEVWAADDLSLTPGAPGTTLLTTTRAHEAPWQCVTGEPCGDEVPDACCPDGRQLPQRISEGALVSKWDEVRFPGVVAGVIYLRVLATDERPGLVFQDLQLIGNGCVGSVGGVRPQPPCRAWGVGEEAGCEAGQWCPPFAENDPRGVTPLEKIYSPRCVTPGGVGLAGACTQMSDCVLGAVCAGGRCERACEEGGPTCGGDRTWCRSPFDTSAVDSRWGFCDYTQCSVPFALECDATHWCAPINPSSVCLPRAGLAEGSACTRPDVCGANALCSGGVCTAVCSSSAGPSGACLDEDLTCVAFDNSAVGGCFTACDYDNPATCGEGRFCWPGESSAASGDVCADVPPSWPGPEGFAPYAPCPELDTMCAPLSFCLGDGNCFPFCRLSAGPEGSDHPDCPASAPRCSAIPQLPGTGICGQ